MVHGRSAASCFDPSPHGTVPKETWRETCRETRWRQRHTPKRRLPQRMTSLSAATMKPSASQPSPFAPPSMRPQDHLHLTIGQYLNQDLVHAHQENLRKTIQAYHGEENVDHSDHLPDDDSGLFRRLEFPEEHVRYCDMEPLTLEVAEAGLFEDYPEDVEAALCSLSLDPKDLLAQIAMHATEPVMSPPSESQTVGVEQMQQPGGSGLGINTTSTTRPASAKRPASTVPDPLKRHRPAVPSTDSKLILYTNLYRLLDIRSVVLAENAKLKFDSDPVYALLRLALESLDGLQLVALHELLVGIVLLSRLAS
ncbi:hypothetical protein BCR44DRAFT_224037 [Catenaria anguillulae PL171]|uniref:Uncharacterized protein n=1 Tax=Catenaria anguillulae PL171 TaxID=765915 RepID=A0A1Y2HYM1_9FUNG|nr:hypothetical protein BCR44DRAFT_224037 [Catenaria anguillulae PL171]